MRNRYVEIEENIQEKHAAFPSTFFWGRGINALSAQRTQQAAGPAKYVSLCVLLCVLCWVR